MIELDSVGEGVLFAISVGVLVASVMLGLWIGRRIRRDHNEHHGEVSTLENASLGLLSLMIGFTFAMALAHYDLRRAAVLDEANAIGTVALRARLLQPPQTLEATNLLRRYVDLRISGIGKTLSDGGMTELIKQSEAIQNRLWQVTVDSAQDPHPVTLGLFVQALNELIDLHAKRLAAARDNIPLPILALLYGIAIVAVGLAGYNAGIGRRGPSPQILVSLLIATVIIMVVDLDRPQGGLVTISQQPMLDLQADLNY
jgi:hypothetical protein